MPDNRELIYADIGSVKFVKSAKAKRMNISVKADGSVRVGVPKRMSFANAEKHFISGIPWVKKQKDKQKKAAATVRKLEKNNTEFDPVIAKKKLLERLQFLADKNGFEYKRAVIKNQKSLWGSCSHVNNINLNINLAKVPQHLTDYVILHELVHTRIKNHSPAFWNELDKYIPNSKAYRRELKSFPLGLL